MSREGDKRDANLDHSRRPADPFIIRSLIGPYELAHNGFSICPAAARVPHNYEFISNVLT